MYNSEFLNTIILLGAIQGFIISCLLWFSKANKQSNHLLSTLVFLISLASFNIYGINHSWFGFNGIAVLFDAYIPLVIIMPLGPLILFYVKSSIDPDFILTKKERRHFYTVLLDFLQHIIAIAYIIVVFLGIIKKADKPVGEFLDIYNQYIDIPRWISVTFYLWLSSKQILQTKNFQKKDRDEVFSIKIRWLQQFIRVFLIFQLFWLLHLIPYLIPRFSNQLLDWGNWYPVYIPLSILIYWLGIKGYIISYQNNASTQKKPGASLELPLKTIQEIMYLLSKTMEEDKLYRNPDLNLPMLAEYIGISQKIISLVLNQHMLTSFNGFINEYRVSEVKKRLLTTESKKMTITGLAYECGFNSQPTFQRSFKAIVGKTPKEFIIENASNPVISSFNDSQFQN
jgi:AraC-like DNA-binding protein